MSRAAITTLAAASVTISLVFAGCSGGTGNHSTAGSPLCGLLEQMAQTGQTVARADVTDPAKFDTTLRAAVTDYVRIAHRLRSAVPNRLRPNVDRLATAVQQYHFDDASAARADIDEYARSKCRSSRGNTSG